MGELGRFDLGCDPHPRRASLSLCLACTGLAFSTVEGSATLGKRSVAIGLCFHCPGLSARPTIEFADCASARNSRLKV